MSGSAVSGIMALESVRADDGNCLVVPDGVVMTSTSWVAVVSGKLPVTDRIDGCTSVTESTLPHGLLERGLPLQATPVIATNPKSEAIETRQPNSPMSDIYVGGK